MNLDYLDLLPKDFSASSRVWIYQSNRLFAMSEALQIEEILDSFVNNWTSHGAPVKGFATMFFGQFIILVADESKVGVGGCSTDSSVRLIKEIEKAFNVSLFERTNLAFVIDNKVQLIPLSQFEYAVKNGFLNAETSFFNNNVLDLDSLKNNWIIPVSKSWLSGRFNLNQV